MNGASRGYASRSSASRGLHRSCTSESSSLSTPPGLTVSESDSPSVARSPRAMAGACGRSRPGAAALVSGSIYRTRSRTSELTSGGLRGRQRHRGVRPDRDTPQALVRVRGRAVEQSATYAVQDRHPFLYVVSRIPSKRRRANTPFRASGGGDGFEPCTAVSAIPSISASISVRRSSRRSCSPGIDGGG